MTAGSTTIFRLIILSFSILPCFFSVSFFTDDCKGVRKNQFFCCINFSSSFNFNSRPFTARIPLNFFESVFQHGNIWFLFYDVVFWIGCTSFQCFPNSFIQSISRNGLVAFVIRISSCFCYDLRDLLCDCLLRVCIPFLMSVTVLLLNFVKKLATLVLAVCIDWISCFYEQTVSCDQSSSPALLFYKISNILQSGHNVFSLLHIFTFDRVFAFSRSVWCSATVSVFLILQFINLFSFKVQFSIMLQRTLSSSSESGESFAFHTCSHV